MRTSCLSPGVRDHDINKVKYIGYIWIFLVDNVVTVHMIAQDQTDI